MLDSMDPIEPPTESELAQSPPRAGLLGALDELLRRPDRFVTAADRQSLRLVILGAILCAVAFGAAAGAFSGGFVVLNAALKAPLIVFGSLLFCLPSLYVFSSLAGVEIDHKSFLAVVVGLSGLVGLLLAAFLPVVWLFSVSSRSLTFVVALHLVFWTTILVYGHRFVRRAFGGSRSLKAWFFLFFLVTLQVSTQLRPVLTPGELVEQGKKSFLEHAEEVLRY